MPVPSRRPLPRARGATQRFEAVLIATSSGAMLSSLILAVRPWQWQNIPLIALIAWAAVVVFGPHCYWRMPFWRTSNARTAMFVVIDEPMDKTALSALFASIDAQKQQPSAVYIVACHSQQDTIVEAVFQQWRITSPIKHASLVPSLSDAILREVDATVFVILDGSRNVLDQSSLLEGCKPFNDAAVTSVSGLHVSFARLSPAHRSKEVGDISRQITEQATYSRFGAARPQDSFILCRGWAAKHAAVKTPSLTPKLLAQEIAHNVYSKNVFMERCIVYTVPKKTHHAEPRSWLRTLCTDTFARVRTLPCQRGAYWLGVLQIVALASQLVGLVLIAVTREASLLTYAACWFCISYAFAARALAMPSSSRRHGSIELCLLVLLLPLLIMTEVLRAFAVPGRTITAVAMGWQNRQVGANAHHG